MPLISRFFIKTGLLWLVISMLLIAFRHMISAGWVGGTEAGLQILFYHTLTVGWITQIIIGVSIWMFPRYSRENHRGPEAVWWSVYILLNLGLIIRALLETNGGYHGSPALTAILITGGWMKAIACVMYAGMIWQRVKAPGAKNAKK